ncbi:UDP-N-acetyl-D-mannosaminuronic acid dehydrogenase [Halopelagius inordinatus]|uniref:UDP-N-acetyl-D-mannosamine dehydrogenase n=1 Tax=Halopelagius inordinatus TaxID=553467 RepID=A0A1I2PMF4_9EURY|nr:nucleotide sugar dehydrogenase [Halopelagius inordinatus]SFG17415.1 UDP-N-acetyl-D-mannosaminuronic acid dehydrogenase [Halopelagius inordinatus]
MPDPDTGICVIGQGYVGLTLTAAMAQSGYDVLGIERDEEKLSDLQQGIPHFDETGLKETIRTQQKIGKLRFRKSLEEADVSDRSVYILAVGSPLDENGEPDTSALESAIKSVSTILEPEDTVIIRSTISVGTSREMLEILKREAEIDIPEELYFLHAPERTVQGDALAEIHNLPQVVGGYDEKSVDRGAEVFSHTADVIIEVDSPEAAEMIKLFDNTYRDINIAIGNAFGEIARQNDLDGQRIIKLANAGYDRNSIMQPGAGVGGGCLPKDPYLLMNSVDEADGLLDSVLQFIDTSRNINESMPDVTNAIIRDALTETGREDGVRSLVLGVAFKGRPGTNDIRNTPAEPIISELSAYGTVDAYDPLVEDEKISSLNARSVEPDDDLTSLFEKEVYDIVVIMNDNPLFENLDLHRVKEGMAKRPIIIDGWNLLPKTTVKQLGFYYDVVGGQKSSGETKRETLRTD